MERHGQAKNVGRYGSGTKQIASAQAVTVPSGARCSLVTWSTNPPGTSMRFVDFMKMGIPLNLLFWGLAVYFIPKFFPF